MKTSYIIASDDDDASGDDVKTSCCIASDDDGTGRSGMSEDDEISDCGKLSTAYKGV